MDLGHRDKFHLRGDSDRRIIVKRWSYCKAAPVFWNTWRRLADLLQHRHLSSGTKAPRTRPSGAMEFLKSITLPYCVTSGTRHRRMAPSIQDMPLYWKHYRTYFELFGAPGPRVGSFPKAAWPCWTPSRRPQTPGAAPRTQEARS